MTRLTWNNPGSRFFEAGLDRGVLYPKGLPAVPWNGLTGVEESGSESSKIYYMDGRPYLIVPTPKEYEATLKAYTYPDEFSELMGVVEATDGMYVDSQQGDSFDLSYRTMVGNDIAGVEAGYKIHLVYNAVVAPQGNSYGSIGSSIEPSEFSWQIQAWPVPLSGHRSSAHIIIDTRHMDQATINEIENLLYGTPEDTPSGLPLPDDIYDLMHFTDEVVITDNGDGTWTAESSYRNISVTADGKFVIRNVNATMLGSGIYYFGDIPPDVIPDPDPTSDLDGGTPDTPGAQNVDEGSPSAGGGVVYDGAGPGS